MNFKFVNENPFDLLKICQAVKDNHEMTIVQVELNDAEYFTRWWYFKELWLIYVFLIF